MKGLSKRFVDHKGKSYDVKMTSPIKRNEDIGFLDLWRYSTWLERAATILGVLISWLCSLSLLGAVLIYGELSVLFVERHNAGETSSTSLLLSLFGGGEKLPEGNRSLHMDALVKDSVAFAWASVVIMVLQLTTAAIAVTLANWAAHRMVNRLRCELLLCVLRQEIAFFDTNTTLNFATALTEDMDKLRAGVGEHVAMTSFLIGSVVSSCALALILGWQLALSGLSIVPVAIIVSATVSKYQTRCSGEEVKSYSIAGRAVEEVLSAIRTVRAYGGEQLEVERYTQLLGGAGKAARKKSIWAGAGAGLGWLLTYAITSVIFAYGAILIVRDMALPPHERDYHPGTLITILLCTFNSSQNITLCNPHIELFSAARGAAKSLFPLLQRTSKIDALKDQGKKPDKFKGDITFDNVYFNYPSRPDVKVLRGLTLSVEAGETIALVGGSGCGKSTLLQLLQRLYEPESGQITVDGHMLDQLHLHNYRRSIGVVGQEPVLFSGTIKENIAFGNEDATDDDIILAAKTAHAHQFIVKLANGYDTWLGERGASLSGGQKQRIAIARAVLRRPAILLLDEPTSALDPAAERQVQAALDAASKGRTTLVVSHRLSTIVNASRIVYIEQGCVLELGTHAELLQRRGAYWKLVQEDMTHKSIDSATQDVSEDDDVVVNMEEPSPLKRATSYSSVQGSISRGSLRLGTVTSAHISTYAAPDHINQTETKEVPDDEDVEEVSGLALLKLNAKEWPLLLGGGVASFIVGATMPTFALLLSKLYGMFAGADPEVILSQSQLYASLFAFVAAVCAVVTFLQAWLFGLAGARLTDRLRVACFGNYLNQEQSWFDQPSNSVGALCARLATDCAAVQGATGTRVGTVLQGVSTLLIGMALALAYSWRMTIVSSFTIPLVIGGIYLEGYMNQRAESEERKALENASRIATEAVINVRTVQSLGVEHTILARYRKALHEAGLHAAVTRIIRGPVYGVCLCAPTLGYAVSMAYGGYLIARADLPYQDAILVSESLIYGAWMLAEALSFAPNFAAAKRSGARIMKALNRKPLIVSEPTARDDPNWHSSGAVSISSVHFRYPTRTNVPVLKGLTLEVDPGRTVALVGTSGCGKSTVMQLLQRCYDPDQGFVALDDKNIKRDLTLPTLRAQLGLVSQEPALFERTIRENIAYGDNSRVVSMEEVVEAAKKASVHNFVAALPLGYETRLGQGGAALSGGQKQRIAIARALVRNPRVLLLDEATSALDANSEKAVQASLVEASKDRTTIMIAHRLATVQHAHIICVIDNGVVAEKGSHEELVRKRGLYWGLLQQQGPNVDT